MNVHGDIKNKTTQMQILTFESKQTILKKVRSKTFKIVTAFQNQSSGVPGHVTCFLNANS